jgi:LemA protein
MLPLLRRLTSALALGATLLLTGCGYNDFQRLDEQVKGGWARC